MQQYENLAMKAQKQIANARQTKIDLKAATFRYRT